MRVEVEKIFCRRGVGDLDFAFLTSSGGGGGGGGKFYEFFMTIGRAIPFLQ